MPAVMKVCICDSLELRTGSGGEPFIHGGVQLPIERYVEVPVEVEGQTVFGSFLVAKKRGN